MGPMKVLVLTGYDDNMKELGDICAPSKERYAKRHGYDYECVREYLPGTHPSWQKIRLLKERIDKYDTILWLDGDTIVTNNHALEVPYMVHYVLTASQDWCVRNTQADPWQFTMGISMGNFVIYNNEDTHRFLDMIEAKKQYANRGQWEQDSVLANMRESDGFNAHVFRLPTHALNSVLPECQLPGIKPHRPWQPGDFLVHLTNIPNRVERAREFADMNLNQ